MQFSAYFQAMEQRVVMGNTGRPAVERGQQQAALGRMQIAARWIHTQRPFGFPVLLPGGQTHAEFQERGNSGQVYGPFPCFVFLVEPCVAACAVLVHERQAQLWGMFEKTKGIRLVGPVHVTERTGIPI